MKKHTIAATFVFLAVLFVSTLASGQTKSAESMPVLKGGISGSVQPYSWGKGPEDMTVVVSLMRNDEANVYFPDLATARRFGPCKDGVMRNCVTRDWKFSISEDQLPVEQYMPWRELDVRIEAKGFFHPIYDSVRVWTGPGNNATTRTIPIYALGITVQKPSMKWLSGDILEISLDVKNDYGMDLPFEFDFVFSGSSWTKSEGKWGALTYSETAKSGSTKIVKTFVAPKDGTADYGGSLCAEIQVRSGTTIYDTSDKSCTALPAPGAWTTIK